MRTATGCNRPLPICLIMPSNIPPPGGGIDIQAFQEDQDTIIRIKDTGAGILPQELPKIWDRLYRGDKSRSQRGLGLGLSLVKAIIQAHKGHVEVASVSGEGSIFTVYIPRKL